MSARVSYRLFGALILCGALTVGCGDDKTTTGTKATIKVGTLFPHTGILEAYARGMKQGVSLAVSEINGAGGVLDKNIEIVSADSKLDPATAVAEAQKLIDKGVVAIIGPASSGVATEVLKAVADKGIPLISPSATSPSLSDDDTKGIFFRTAPSDAKQGKVAAEYALQTLQKKTAAILYVDNAYGKGLYNSFKLNFEANAGGQVVTNVSYTPDVDPETYSFTDESQKLFALKPDLVYLITYQKDGAKFTHAAKTYFTASYTPQLLGCDGNSSQDFVTNSDETVITNIIGTAPTVDVGDSNYKTYSANYKKVYTSDPEQYSEGAYDAMYMVALALQSSGAETAAAVRDNLEKVSKTDAGDVTVNVGQFSAAITAIKENKGVDYNGATGKVELDDKGDPTDAHYKFWNVKRNSDGKLELATMQTPQ